MSVGVFRRLVFAFGLFVLPFSDGQGLDFSAIPCQHCPQLTYEHYRAKDCEAVFDNNVSECCPVSFICRSEEERGLVTDKCYYKGKAYDKTQTVPLQPVCDQDCYCREPVSPNATATVECVIIDCPVNEGYFSSNCRLLYDSEECCEHSQWCEEPYYHEQLGETVTPPGPLQIACEVDGEGYIVGEKMTFKDHPCQTCICTDNFSGPYGANCTTRECGLEYKYREELRAGCTPIYYDGNCCPLDFLCPDSTILQPTPEQQSTSIADVSPDSHCVMGDIVAPINATLAVEGCHTNCICRTPPEFTCIKYPTCERAQAAKTAGEHP